MGSTNLLIAGAALLLLLGAFLFLRNRSALSEEQIMELKRQGAVVVDVRSPGEFQEGHAPGSLNIPLRQLPARLGELDHSRPILVCCASGARSAVAKGMLEKAGYANVHNAGPWTALR